MFYNAIIINCSYKTANIAISEFCRSLWIYCWINPCGKHYPCLCPELKLTYKKSKIYLIMVSGETPES